MVDDYEGPLFSAWGRWREDMSEEENEQCLNPLYYVFGSGDTDYDDASSSTPLSSQFGSILTDSTSLSDTGGKFGRYSAEREVTPVSVVSVDVDYYRQGLLIPETSLCSMKVWAGFFFRFLPELGECHRVELLEVQLLEARMVKDVQKLKEELNEVELSLGAYTTDLPSCIGEVEMAREREIMDERRESVEVGMPLRPRLTASVYSYTAIEGLEEALGREGEEAVEGGVVSTLDDAATPVNSPHSTPTKHQQPKHQLKPLKQSQNGSISSQVSIGSDPSNKQLHGGIPVPLSPTSLAHGGLSMEPSKSTGKQTSLAQFTDALYSSEGVGSRPKTVAEMTVPPGLTVGTSRSPVTKTRLRVVKSQAADPVVAAWQQSSPRPVVKLREPQFGDKNTGTVNEVENRLTIVSGDSQLTKL